MEYEKRILLNWIFYNNNLTYSIEARDEIIKFVDEYYEDALLACSYLYSKKQNSTKIFLAVDKGTLKDYILGINKKIIDSSTGSLTNLLNKVNSYKELFFTENVNRFKRNFEEGITGSCLENLLVNWFEMINLFPKESMEYLNFMNLIKKYGNEVIDALFINSMGSNRVYKYFLKALTDGDFEKFANYVRVTARNFEITYKEKYYILRNKFILALEDVVCKTHEDFTDKIYAEEERKCKDDYLNGETPEKEGKLR